jgi:hypothetical protein
MHDRSFPPTRERRISQRLAEHVVTICRGLEEHQIPVIVYAHVRQHRETIDEPLIHDPPGYMIRVMHLYDVAASSLFKYEGWYFGISIPWRHWRDAEHRLLDYDPVQQEIRLR